MLCDHCKKEMTKKNVYESGNSKYQRWFCALCRTEKSQALGLVGGMPK